MPTNFYKSQPKSDTQCYTGNLFTVSIHPCKTPKLDVLRQYVHTLSCPPTLSRPILNIDGVLFVFKTYTCKYNSKFWKKNITQYAHLLIFIFTENLRIGFHETIFEILFSYKFVYSVLLDIFHYRRHRSFRNNFGPINETWPYGFKIKNSLRKGLLWRSETWYRIRKE